jgi:hypothetical protein
MKDAQTRRIVPISTITLVCIVVLALFQMLFLFGAYEIKSSTFKNTSPWIYWTFRKLVGETPSTRQSASTPVPEEQKSSSALATVAGFKPEELSVTIENIETPLPEETVSEEPSEALMPVSKPEPEPVDENKPVG